MRSKLAVVVMLVLGLIFGLVGTSYAAQPEAVSVNILSADQYNVTYTITGAEKNNRLFDHYIVGVWDDQTSAYYKTFPNEQNLRFNELNVTSTANFFGDGATWSNGSYPARPGKHTLVVYFYSSTKPIYIVNVDYYVP